MIADEIGNAPPPLHAFKKAKNIRDYVVRALLPTASQPSQTVLWGIPPIRGHVKCGNCKVCPLTQETKEFKYNNHTHVMRDHSNCNSSGVIYAITCPCGFVYIGQTIQKAKCRILQHISRIKCKTQGAPLVEHFMRFDHAPDSLTWCILEKVSPNPRGGDFSQILSVRECRFIHFFDTIKRGLNEYEEINKQVSILNTG